MSDKGLRAIFNEDAELYHRARPSYPANLFRGLDELAEIGPGAQVAEIGPGTGQATVALVARGAQVVAVELGAELAIVLKRKLAGAAVEVVISAFEEWTVAGELFDTVAAFTAWHWLDPVIQTPKAATALRPGGALATVTTCHVVGGPRRSSPTRRTATSGGTRLRHRACGCRRQTRSLLSSTRSMTRNCSGQPFAGAISKTSATPPAATFSCLAPTPVTAP